MKYKSKVMQISFTGLLVALAVLLGAFAHFPLFGGQVYLVGIVIFLMPLVLRYWYALIGAIISIVLTDLITGWIQFTWISIIAYSVGISIIFIFSLAKLKILYIPGLLIAGVVISSIYFFLELTVVDRALAISDLWATLLEFAIVVPATIALYTPIKLLSTK